MAEAEVQLKVTDDSLESTPFVTMPEFELSDKAQWLKFLKENGVVVIRNVLPSGDVEKARGMFWDWVEEVNPKVHREDPNTWATRGPEWGDGRGFISRAAHSPAAWFIRSHPRLFDAFSTAWDGAKNLLASFGSFVAWRPLSDERFRRPYVEGLHLDQNPFNKPEFRCYQGMVPLMPVDLTTGGLRVVVKTHNDEEFRSSQKEKRPHGARHGDWWTLAGSLPEGKNAQLVRANPGDLILWDGRTVHEGFVGSGSHEKLNELSRLSLIVCLMPYHTMKKGHEAEILRNRMLAFEQGAKLTHWANEAGDAQGVTRSLGSRVSIDHEFNFDGVGPSIRDLVGHI